MSIINNVLKDLETRESRFTPIEIGSVGKIEVAQRNLKAYGLVGLLLLALLASTWVLLQGSARFEPQPLAMSDPVAPSIAVEAAVAPVVANPASIAADNQIVGLQIRELEDEMRLEFALRDKVVAYLRERGENNFGYHLRDIDSEIVAPVMSDNPWIVELLIEARDGGVDVSFRTAPDILVETRQQKRDGEALWQINLKQNRPAVALAAPAPVADRQPDESGLSSTVVPSAPVSQVEVVTPPPEIAAPPAVIAEKQVVKLDIKSTNPGAKSQNQLDYAVELINSRRYTDAENLLRGLFAGDEEISARQHLLALYSRQKRSEPSFRLAQESMQRYPEQPVFKSEYARLLFQRKAYRKVIELFATDGPRDAAQQALLAASYQRLDRHDDAVRHYQLALAQDRGNAKNWIGLGISQEHNSAFADALNSYQTAGRLGRLNGRLQAFVDKRSDTLKRVLN